MTSSLLVLNPIGSRHKTPNRQPKFGFMVMATRHLRQWSAHIAELGCWVYLETIMLPDKGQWVEFRVVSRWRTDEQVSLAAFHVISPPAQ